MAQRMPLPPTVSCFSKIQIGLTFLVPAHLGSPIQRAINQVCVCCLGLPGGAGTRKVKPIWTLLKQETVSGSGISWAICKSTPCSTQITMPAPHNSNFFCRLDALPPPKQQRQSTESRYILYLKPRSTCVWKTCIGRLPIAERLRIKSASCRLLVKCPAYYATTSHIKNIISIN